MSKRREFIQGATLTAASFGLLPRLFAAETGLAHDGEIASFFVVGDTHYCADEKQPDRMLPHSQSINRRLIGWLNNLPGTDLPGPLGGGKLPVPQGVIHAGDLVDNGDKGPPKLAMADVEMKAFTADWGLNGSDGLLKWPVREVHGNHDGPRGDTTVVTEIKARNLRRKGLAKVSPNGLHYSWDWHGIHFVALGIVVGDAPAVTRKRRYAPLGSLPFMIEDLKEQVGDSGRPVVLIHHIDAARYSKVVPDQDALHQEWDHGDVAAYHEALKPYRVAASICGHTHARNIFRWDGTPDTRPKDGGIPFLNTDNAGHFAGPSQAFLHVEVSKKLLRVREFSTKDGWLTGDWNSQVWDFPLGA